MTTVAHSIIKGLVKDVLLHPEQREWTLQGLGMLRTYFGPEIRLHVWDSRFAWVQTSRHHTHPWDFSSLIVAGVVHQQRFTEVNPEALAVNLGVAADAKPFIKETVHCGYEFKNDPTPVHLLASPTETYRAGEWYGQDAEEIHDSTPEDGTVTIIYRRFLEDTEMANIYRPAGTIRENAGARKATPEEIQKITQYALNTWFAP